jgi:hypothetical protein
MCTPKEAGACGLSQCRQGACDIMSHDTHAQRHSPGLDIIKGIHGQEGACGRVNGCLHTVDTLGCALCAGCNLRPSSTSHDTGFRSCGCGVRVSETLLCAAVQELHHAALSSCTHYSMPAPPSNPKAATSTHTPLSSVSRCSRSAAHVRGRPPHCL